MSSTLKDPHENQPLDPEFDADWPCGRPTCTSDEHAAFSWGLPVGSRTDP